MPRRGRLKPGREAAPTLEWAGAILANASGELLLNLRDSGKDLFPGLWDVIGGTLEPGETPEACVLREIREETGESLAEVRYLERFDFSLADGRAARLHLFAGALDKPAASLLLGEGQAHRFFPPNELDSLPLVPGLRPVLHAYAHASRQGDAGSLIQRRSRISPSPKSERARGGEVSPQP